MWSAAGPGSGIQIVSSSESAIFGVITTHITIIVIRWQASLWSMANMRSTIDHSTRTQEF